MKYELRTFENMPHTVNQEVLDTVKAFLLKTIPHDELFIVKPKPPAEMSVKELKAAIVRAGIQSKALGLNEKSEFVELLESYYASRK